MRWKNPHPKRAVNARTVLKGDLLEEEQPPLAKVLCLKIPPPVVDDDDDDDDDYTKRNDDCDEVSGEEKERTTRVRCLREDVSISVRFGRTYAYAHEREAV